jgi:hypothetical protein
MRFDIKARITDKILFSADIPDDTPPGFQARAALQPTSRCQPRGCQPSPEEIARLDEVREIVLKQPKRLVMASWHSGNWTPEHTPEEEHACGSAHCIAGWLQALCPDPKVRQMDPMAAGVKLAPASAYMFSGSDTVARQWLKDRGYAQAAKP